MISYIRKVMFISVVLIFSVLFSGAALSFEVGEGYVYDEPGSYTIESLEFPDLKDAARGDRKVPLKVHYPVDAGSFPLVIMSHGGGGTWDGHLYQAQYLASHGYVVICPEHVYSNSSRIKYYKSADGGGMSFWKALHHVTKDPAALLERPKDVSFAIDQGMLLNRENSELLGKIDTGKVAVMGHSYGAYTTLVVCGARPILDHMEPAVAPGRGLAGDLSDPRVTFGLAMSPQSPGTTYFSRKSYRTINRPLVCLTGSKDTQKSASAKIMLAYRRWQVLRLLPRGQKYFLWFKNADHLSFSDNPKAHLFPSKSREDMQRISKTMMVLFCDYFLKENEEALDKMNKKYVDSLCGKVVTNVKWHEK